LTLLDPPSSFPPKTSGYGRVFLGQYGEQQVAVKAVFGERRLGIRGEDDIEAELQERRERMIQVRGCVRRVGVVSCIRCGGVWTTSRPKLKEQRGRAHDGGPGVCACMEKGRGERCAC
jgi:hypothetical protein